MAHGQIRHVHSNTKLLEDRFGWKGVLVEPSPEMAHPELSTVANEAATDLHTDARFATAVRTVAVPTVSLNDLLVEHSAPASIDFMSVDTDGTELRILRAFDFSRFSPRLVAVEHNGRDDEREIDALMFATAMIGGSPPCRAGTAGTGGWPDVNRVNPKLVLAVTATHSLASSER